MLRQGISCDGQQHNGSIGSISGDGTSELCPSSSRSGSNHDRDNICSSEMVR